MTPPPIPERPPRPGLESIQAYIPVAKRDAADPGLVLISEHWLRSAVEYALWLESRLREHEAALSFIVAIDEAWALTARDAANDPNAPAMAKSTARLWLAAARDTARRKP